MKLVHFVTPKIRKEVFIKSWAYINDRVDSLIEWKVQEEVKKKLFAVTNCVLIENIRELNK